jgi:predicted porin
MQKKIIALAVAAAFSAPAFADSTVYGIVDAAVAAVSGAGQKGDLIAVSGGASTSRLGVKGAEDVAGGLKVVYALEYKLDTQTIASIGAARQQLLGVAGDFGTVATGYLQTTGYDFGVKFDPIAGSSVSSIQSVTSGGGFYIGAVAGASRAQRALAYISPNINGLTFAVNYSTALAGLGNLTVDSSCKGDAAVAATTTTAACTVGGLKSTALLASGSYSAGPLNAGLVYFKSGNDNSGAATVSEYALGGSYDLSVVKVFGTYQNSKASTATKANTAVSLAAILPVSTGAFGVTFAKSTMATADTGMSGFTLGYLHTVSPTVTGYIAYESVKNGAATNSYSVDNNAIAGTAPNATTGLATSSMDFGGSSSLVAIGLRKKF